MSAPVPAIGGSVRASPVSPSLQQWRHHFAAVPRDRPIWRATWA